MGVPKVNVLSTVSTYIYLSIYVGSMLRQTKQMLRKIKKRF